MEEQELREIQFHDPNHEENNTEHNKNLHPNYFREDVQYYFIKLTYINKEGKAAEQEYTVAKYIRNIEELAIYMRRFTSTVPARGARASNRAISNSCL